MESRQFIANELSDLPHIAKQILDWQKQARVFAFYGEMGAGKTTFIQRLCACLGVEDQVLSPTFAIVNEYKTKDDQAVYHFDFYRINNLREAMDIGYEEYFYSGNYCFVEWTQKIEELLPPSYVKVEITVNEQYQRLIQLSVIK
ncbi:MAG: tRNA (adenosine(37)-N6)-threonylcarbamoyltransferase complex ATPase subunit type 1 TsaE [Bacteroidales bacterium]